MHEAKSISGCRPHLEMAGFKPLIREVDGDGDWIVRDGVAGQRVARESLSRKEQVCFQLMLVFPGCQ